MRKFLEWFTIVFIAISGHSAVGQDSIRLVTGNDFGQFAGEDLDGGGMATEVARSSFRAASMEPEFVFDDWSKGFEQTKNNEYDGTLPYYFVNTVSDPRPDHFVYGDSSYSAIERIFMRSGDPRVFDISSPRDLEGFKLCYPSGWAAPPEIQALFDSGVINREVPGNMERCFRLLGLEQVDAVLAPEIQGYETAEKEPELGSFAVDTSPWDVTIRTLSVIFPKSAGAAKACSNAVRFNAGLATIRANGSFNDIARKWFGNLAQLTDPTEKYEITLEG